MTKEFKVGVFPGPGTQFVAYTTWYNAQWKGCCEHRVIAANGTLAKKTAINLHKSFCLNKDEQKRVAKQLGVE